MIKVNFDHGKMKEFDFGGTIIELSADLALIFQLIYQEIRDRNGEDGKRMAEAFAGCVKESVGRAEKTAQDIEKYKAMFSSKMDSLVKELKEAMLKEMNEEENTDQSRFSDDFHKFLYGEDDTE